jgi:hypothetical protein
MPLTSDFPFRFVSFSPPALRALPPGVRRSLNPFLDSQLHVETSRSLVVAVASDLIRAGVAGLPQWRDADTRYLILADVPEPALFQLPTILRVHKPDQRIHVTRNRDALKRSAIALTRDHVHEGIIDAYLLMDDLHVVLGDLSIRAFPLNRLTFLTGLTKKVIQHLTVHSSGSYIHWPDHDIRVGASQLLQAVDPMYLADVAIERYALEKVSLALRVLREDGGLTQAEIQGLSDRHVRRLENEEVRLTSDAAEKYASSLGMPLSEFLGQLGRVLVVLKDDGDTVEIRGVNV